MTIQDLDAYIYVDRLGRLVVESIVRRYFIGDYDLLLSCVEDNIHHGDDGEEVIDWNGVEKDYAETLNKKEKCNE